MIFFVTSVIGLAGWLAWGVPAASASATSVWVEGEDAVRTNFNPGHFIYTRPEDGGATGGMYLRLHVFKKELPPSPGPFFAAYEFDVPQAGRYRIWMRGSQQDSGGLEPFWVSVDGKAFVNLKGKAWMGSGEGIDQPWTYLGWFEAGRAELSAGRHRMRVEIRSARPQDELYAGFIDAILLTTDGQFVPTGTHVKYSPYPAWAEQMKARTYKEYHHEVERKWYRKRIALCEAEEANAKASEEVRRKLSGRTLPAADETKGRDRRFGLQGMVWSFIEAGKDEPKVRGVYDLLARAGVASFRTTDSLWFRVGEKADDFKELDFQIASAARYGQTFMFMIGFPPAGFGQGKGTFTAVRPEHDKAYRTYLRTLFERYRDKGVVKFAELGNEVDAPEVWWTDSTPDLYVREMKIVCDEVRKADPRVKLLAFGATYSRDEQKNGPNEGRNFVRRCFDLGIGRYTDGYSLHYTWGLDQKDFTRFFREQADRTGGGKLLVNSEDSGHGEPYTIVKMFARNLFLYGYERVYYYLARDWSENGALQPTGLFDIDWNPKVRLLAYAASVDAMRGRRLTGLASPAGGVEAYVLERDPDRGGDGPAYSVVMWRNGAAEGLEVSSVGKASDDSARIISVPGTVSAWSWRLDPIAFDRAKPEFRLAGYEPVVVFTDVKPEWKMVGPEEWLKAVYRAKGNGKIPMPAR